MALPPHASARLAAVAALLLAVPLAGAQAEPPAALADVAFTVSVAEPSDTPPQPIEGLDLVEVALGEPGDGTLVFRATLAAAPDAASAGSRLYFGFTTPAGDIVGGCGYDGAPQTRNIGEAIAPDSCAVSGNLVYAVYEYGTAEVAVGAPVTQIWGFTDGCTPAACLPADTAPGGVANQGWPASTFGADYTPTGCTRASGCAGAGPSGAPILENLTGPTATVAHGFTNSTNATYLYNWTGPGSDLALLADANVTAGSVSFNVTDAANRTVANGTFQASGNQTLVFNGTAGNWTIQVHYENFTGNFQLVIAAYVPEAPPVTETATNTTTTREPTGSFPLRTVDKGTPGVGLPGLVPALLLSAAVAALAVRRRLE